MRHKTKLAIVEKEKEKMARYIEASDNDGSKVHSRVTGNYGQKAPGDKDNAVVRNLKKMIREAKEENDYLKQENVKIKKATKYTKINELEIERKMMHDENLRVNKLLEELTEKINEQEDYER